jgi:hypothetical protein
MVRERLELVRVVGQRLVGRGVELMDPRPRLSRPAVLLIVATVASGAAALLARMHELALWSTADLLAMGALIGATIVGESFSVRISFGRETKHITLTEAAYAAALLVGVRPGVLTVAVALGVGASNVARGTTPHKAVFNVGSWLAAVTAAELAFGAAHGAAPIVGVTLAMTAFFVVNAGTVLGIIALATGRSLAQVFRPLAAIETAHAAGNLVLGLAAATLWTVAPLALLALAGVSGLALAAYRLLSPAAGRVVV